MNITLWTVQLILAVIFLMAGTMKYRDHTTCPDRYIPLADTDCLGWSGFDYG